MRLIRMLGRIVAALALIVLAVTAWAYWSAVSDPLVRRADIAMPDWPEGAPPVTVALISDIHVAGPDMPPARVARIVERINALRPDLVLIAGDLAGENRLTTHRYSFAEAAAPLAGLRPRLGTYAVMGNHDHRRSVAEAHRALAAAGIGVLDNQAVAAGPLALGGLDDDPSGLADLAGTVAAMRRLPGAKLLLSHGPDRFPELPADLTLMLAGHTHCGQIRLPFYGAVGSVSRYGARYECGLIRERGRTLIVTAGLGASVVPLRLGAPPDLWLIRLGPRRR